MDVCFKVIEHAAVNTMPRKTVPTLNNSVTEPTYLIFPNIKSTSF